MWEGLNMRRAIVQIHNRLEDAHQLDGMADRTQRLLDPHNRQP